MFVIIIMSHRCTSSISLC